MQRFFQKMSGAGNDFIIVDMNQNPGLILTSEKLKVFATEETELGQMV